MTPEQLLSVYDREIRGTFADHLYAGWTAQTDGPLTRCLTPRDGFAQFTADASGLSVDELIALVDRTFAYFGQRGLGFEWKTFDHDRADLIPLLVERGSQPEPHEAIVMGDASALAADVRVPAGLTLSAVSERADLDRIAEMLSGVWNEDRSWLAGELEARMRGGEPIEVFVVKDGDLVVSAAWLVPLPGTRVAGLWGGSTRAEYRGRGIYRALVAHRARIANETGYGILQVDATDDSRPILERLGLHVVGGTTPYVWQPVPS